VRMTTVRKLALSPPQQKLVDLLGRVGFGAIEGLAVIDGAPSFTLPPKIIRIIKLREEIRPRFEADRSDFILKTQVVQLLACMRELGNGTIRRIEVQDGLPFKVMIESVGDPFHDASPSSEAWGCDE
jgi:hypothetical protein